MAAPAPAGAAPAAPGPPAAALAAPAPAGAALAAAAPAGAAPAAPGPHALPAVTLQLLGRVTDGHQSTPADGDCLYHAACQALRLDAAFVAATHANDGLDLRVRLAEFYSVDDNWEKFQVEALKSQKKMGKAASREVYVERVREPFSGGCSYASSSYMSYFCSADI